jgi:YVTN family beta-propeller protein
VNPPSFITEISFGLKSTTSNTITRDGRFAVTVAGENQVSSIDIASKTILSTVNIPFGNSVAITPDGTTVIVTDNSGNVFRIFALSPQGTLSDTGHTVAFNFQVFSGALAMAPNGRFALFPNRGGNNVAILRIDAQHNVTVSGTTIPICCQPGGVEFTPDGAKAYVTNSQSSDVAVLSIDPNDNVTDTGTRIPIPNGITGGFNGVSGIAIAVDGRAYISNTTLSTVTIVDTKTDTVLGTISVPQSPTGIGVPR